MALASPIDEMIVTCEPGGEAVETRVPIEHTAKTLDRLTLRLYGLDPAWYRFDPADVTLRPGENAEAKLFFAVPRAAVAGRYPYRVAALASGGSERGLLSAALEVNALPELRLEVLPYRQRARGAADFRVRLHNAGNAELLVRLFADEPGSTLRFTLDPEDVSLIPGEECVGRIRVRPTGVSQLGPPKSLVFWVGALPGGDELALPLAQAGAELLVLPRLTYVPPTGRWLVRVIPMVIVLVMVVVVLVLRFWPVG